MNSYPPDVGIADPKSAIANPTMNMNMEGKNQPQTNPTGPAGIEKASVEAMLGSRPMIEKAMPKTSIIEKLRLNSCLYLYSVNEKKQYSISSTLPHLRQNSGIFFAGKRSVDDDRTPALAGALAASVMDHRGLSICHVSSSSTFEVLFVTHKRLY